MRLHRIVWCTASKHRIDPHAGGSAKPAPGGRGRPYVFAESAPAVSAASYQNTYGIRAGQGDFQPRRQFRTSFRPSGNPCAFLGHGISGISLRPHWRGQPAIWCICHWTQTDRQAAWEALGPVAGGDDTLTIAIKLAANRDLLRRRWIDWVDLSRRHRLEFRDATSGRFSPLDAPRWACFARLLIPGWRSRSAPRLALVGKLASWIAENRSVVFPRLGDEVKDQKAKWGATSDATVHLGQPLPAALTAH